MNKLFICKIDALKLILAGGVLLNEFQLVFDFISLYEHQSTDNIFFFSISF